MKFLPLRDFDDITSALNFDTPDCRVIGSCDLYTTKAAGSDKKLYRNIEHSLESQYESLLRLSASLSPPEQSSLGTSLNLSRSSPFGPLSQVSSRKTFAYLIATLNASHPDYDFSHILRPTDFKRERSLKTVMNVIDSTLYNLQPNPSLIQNPAQTAYSLGSSPLPAAQTWGPGMWNLIDKEMALKDCSIYCYAPEEDPYDGEEGTVWSLNYFFFNKERKRVVYIHLRGVPISSHSPRQHHKALGGAKRGMRALEAIGTHKRARSSGADGLAKPVMMTKNELPTFDDGDLSDLSNEDLDEDLDDYEEFDLDDDSDAMYPDSIRGVSEDIASQMEIEV